MAHPNLKKRDTVTLTVEVFDVVDFDEDATAELAADATGFFRKLLEGEGRVVNGLMMDEKMLGEGPTNAGAAPVPQVYHCEAPPEFASKWITIVL